MKNLSRKEAAKILEDMKVKIEIPKAAVTQWERNAALDMAIEVLKYSGVPNSSDCIIRQDAIDLLKKWSDGYKYIETETESAIKEFQRLPSAQPEPSQVARDIATIIENEKDMRVIASAQPDRKNGEWTYCSDHQPKKDGRYIVTIKFDDRLTIVSDLYFRMDIYDEFDEDRNEHRPGWLSWSDEYGFSLYYDESKVIAWIPYPKPAEDDNGRSERA